MTTPQPRPNRLLQENSPYLQQHAYNPVDWYPWGPEALERSRAEDRPILLSIGYSTCHWCHVMAHESFENPDIARIMNEHFINIKVDREERPDLDDIYMNCVQMMTGRGGWPLTVFLTSELKPFYGGTYFPPEDRGGLPGFARLLTALGDSYRTKRDTIEKVAGQLTAGIQMLAASPGTPGEPAVEVLDQAADKLLQDFDQDHGGFGGAPKFPPSLDLDFLGRLYHRTGREEVLRVITFTLAHMALGGIYDQLGGGFHRYATDAAWAIPHFEKMLYDNALLVRRYLEVFQLSGDPWFSQVAWETLDYVRAEMTAPHGGLYAAQDADSDGVEGKFFVWTPAEVEQVVGAEVGPLVCLALGVSPIGNFEHGTSVLHRGVHINELAERFGLTPEGITQILLRARQQLKEARDQRVKPHRDEKIITAWNGLMISALARGGQVLGEGVYAEAAARAARFILEGEARTGRLRRVWGADQTSGAAFLEDYAYLVAALLDLFETDFDPGWLEAAVRLTAEMEDRFHDGAGGGYFYPPADHEALIVRPKNFFDHAIPSGNAVAAMNLIRLHRLTEQERYRERAGELLSLLQEVLPQSPRALAATLAAQEAYLAPEVALTLVGRQDDPVIREMLAAIHRRYLPNRRLVLKTPENREALEKLAPAVTHYDAVDGRPTAFVCHGFTCLEPVHTAAALEETLQGLPRP